MSILVVTILGVNMTKKFLLIAAGLFVLSATLRAQIYTLATTTLPNVGYSASAWGDFDNDGDLDLVLAGMFPNASALCEIYRNDAGAFTDVDAGLIPIRSGDVAWGDYDNDGDLDLAAVGDGNSVYISRVYRNDSGSFTAIDFGGPEMYMGSICWVDFDTDGDLDISIMGSTLDGDVTTIYRNDGSDQFTALSIGLPEATRGAVDWGDFDEDGDPDVLFTGRLDSNLKPRSYIFRNDGGAMTMIPTNFLHVYDSEARWLDFDRDGDLDALIAGSDSTSGFPFTDVYRNNGGVFSDIHATIDGNGEGGAIDLGDIDNDGDLDVAQLGVFGPGSDLYRYNGDSVFSRLMLTTQVSCCGTATIADYDADGDLDFLVSGLSTRTRFYQCSGVTANSSPTPPNGLNAVAYSDSATLSWSPGNDAETGSMGLSYNVRIGSTPGGVDIVSPMADPSNGYRKITGMGNAYTRLNFKFHDLSPGTYYWSVQSIDTGWRGSMFAVEQSFTVPGGGIVCGDADGNSFITISDAVFLISYIFSGGPAPTPLQSGDADCNSLITISDAVYLITYIFSGGAAPCASCP